MPTTLTLPELQRRAKLAEAGRIRGVLTRLGEHGVYRIGGDGVVIGCARFRLTLSRVVRGWACTATPLRKRLGAFEPDYTRSRRLEMDVRTLQGAIAQARVVIALSLPGADAPEASGVAPSPLMP